jgi:hypothetical protein
MRPRRENALRQEKNMSNPIVVDLPHTLGAEEARRRIDRNMGKMGDQIPGGADVTYSWTGDRMNLRIGAMGQDITATVDVRERVVRLEVVLPGALGFFGKGIEALLRRQGAVLLEDKSNKR